MTLTRSTLSLTGDLNIQTAAENATAILAALDAQTGLDIDLRGVIEIDTAGLQVLLLARHEAHAQGVHLRFTEPAACVREVLELLGLDETLSARSHGEQVQRANASRQR